MDWRESTPALSYPQPHTFLDAHLFWFFFVDGKVHTANLKAYKFEQLDRETKVEVLKTIKENFKKEYLKDDTEE